MSQQVRLMVDTREQQPLTFEDFEDIVIWRDTLDVGDYTISGHDRPADDHSVIIERKANCKELVTNLGAEWDRFKREAEILSNYKIKQIVVCGPDNFGFLYDKKYTKLHPNFIYRQLGILLLDYGISTIFLPDRKAAESYIFRLFYNILKKTESEN